METQFFEWKKFAILCRKSDRTVFPDLSSYFVSWGNSAPFISTTENHRDDLKLASDVRLVRLRRDSLAIQLACMSDRLREFPHCPVNGQRRFRIWSFRLPFSGFNHYQPPYACYNELFAPTATKCSGSRVLSYYWSVLRSSYHAVAPVRTD